MEENKLECIMEENKGDIYIHRSFWESLIKFAEADYCDRLWRLLLEDLGGEG